MIRALPATARGVVLGYGAFNVAELAAWVMVLLHAFDQGGVSRASTVMIVQLVPAATFAPVAGLLCSRLGAGRVLVTGYAVQTVLLAGTGALILAGSAPAGVYAVAALATTSMTVVRPALAATFPGVCHTAADLTMSNVSMSRVESIGAFLGPVASVAIVGPLGVGAGVLAAAGGTALAAVMSTGAWGERASLAEVAIEDVDPVRAGRRVLASPEATVLLMALSFQGFLVGTLDVLAAAYAEQALALGSGASGLVGGAMGLGGIGGGIMLGRLMNGRRLPLTLSGSLVLLGAGLVVSGEVTATVPALGGFAFAGIGWSLNDSAGRALMQRSVPEDLIGPVFALRESMCLIGLAVGGFVAPPLVSVAGVARAVTAVGLAAIVGAVMLVPWIVRIAARATVPVVEVALLRKLPVFAVLPPVAMEALARAAREERFAAGDIVVREGEVGDRYYAIVSGRCAVVLDGRACDEMRRGDGFGELSDEEIAASTKAWLEEIAAGPTVDLGDLDVAELIREERADRGA